MSSDPHSRWVGSMPEIYDRCLGEAVFRPFAMDLAQRAAGLRPRRVLEIAAGTGVLTAELLKACPAAEVTATGRCPPRRRPAVPVRGAPWLHRPGRGGE